MRPSWRTHLMICLFLGGLAIPIYYLDLAFTGADSDNWITLDFRGLIFYAYVALLVIHIVLSSIGVASFQRAKALSVHIWSMVLSLILLAMGFVIYGKLLRARISDQPAQFSKNCK
jgi:hypothetical protein